MTGRDNLMRLLIQKATGAQWNFISFPSGGERLSNLLGGHVQMMVIEPQEAGEQIRAGNLRVIASLTEKRLRFSAERADDQGARHRYPAHPSGPRSSRPAGGTRKDVVQYWEGVFDRFAKTPPVGNSTWNKISSKTAISKGPPLSKFFDELTVQMRDVLKEAGAKVVR